MAVTQKRDSRGRFVKNWYEEISEYNLSEEAPLKTPKRVWLSHNRAAIIYFVACFLVGLIGGYIGVNGKL